MKVWSVVILLVVAVVLVNVVAVIRETEAKDFGDESGRFGFHVLEKQGGGLHSVVVVDKWKGAVYEASYSAKHRGWKIFSLGSAIAK
jgi:hypothetical protein